MIAARLVHMARRGKRTAVALAAACAGALAAAAPASAELVFSSARCDQGGYSAAFLGGCYSGIFRMNDDGTGQTRLTDGGVNPATYDPMVISVKAGDGGPSWSPNGQRIVFARRTGNFTARLWIMNADGSDQQTLGEPPPSFASASSPDWSPKGNHIAFVSGAARESPGEEEVGEPLFVMDADGTNPRKLTPDGWDVTSPDFTPDGAHIIFFGFPQGIGSDELDYGLYQTDLKGRHPRRLTFMGDILIAANGATVSPDGKYLAFTRSGGVYTMRLSDGAVVNRSHTVALTPTWSPIGPTLFFIGTPDGTVHSSQLFSLNLRTGNERTLLEHGKSGSAPDWGDPEGDDPPIDPVPDRAPPAVITGEEMQAAANGKVVTGARTKRGRIRFLAVDKTGIRRIEVAIGKRVEGGCRFVGRGGKLRSRKRCAEPHYFTVRTPGGWRSVSEDLRDGTYEVRFRTTDFKGHRTKHPKRRVIRLK